MNIEKKKRMEEFNTYTVYGETFYSLELAEEHQVEMSDVLDSKFYLVKYSRETADSEFENIELLRDSKEVGYSGVLDYIDSKGFGLLSKKDEITFPNAEISAIKTFSTVEEYKDFLSEMQIEKEIRLGEPLSWRK